MTLEFDPISQTVDDAIMSDVSEFIEKKYNVCCYKYREQLETLEFVKSALTNNLNSNFNTIGRCHQ